MHQKLSHSCDDLLNDSDLPTSPLSSPHDEGPDPQPSITITTPGKIRGLAAPGDLYRGLEEESDEDDSESELEFEILSPGTRLPGSVNPMVDILEGVGSAGLRESEEDEGAKKSDDDSSASGGVGGGGGRGKFSRFRDKFRNPFSRSRSPQPEGEGEESSPQKSPSPQPEDERAASLTASTTITEEHGASQSKLAAVRQRFKSNPPNLWHKMRRASPVAPSEEELALHQARKTSKSRIIYIS